MFFPPEMTEPLMRLTNACVWLAWSLVVYVVICGFAKFYQALYPQPFFTIPMEEEE